MTWLNSLFILTIGIHIGYCYGGGIHNVEKPKNIDCTEYRNVLEDSLVEATAVYFANHPIRERESFSPSEVKPLTAENLFKMYYGEGASSRAFKEAISQILHTDPGCEEAKNNTDKPSLRNRIYSQVRAKNYFIARQMLGGLFYQNLNDLGDESWKNYRCILTKDLALVKKVFAAELSRLRANVGEGNFETLLSLRVGTMLAYAIDDTGSMSEEIDAARRRSHLLIDQRAGSLDMPTSFVLVPFNDPKVGPVTSTNDPDKLKDAFENVYAHGGGDLPELSMKGISYALEKCRPSSTIYVITDAEAKDAELQDKVIATANRKRIKLTFLLTSRMTSWLCAGFSSTRRLPACRDRSLKLGFELYQHLAERTGGEVLVVQRKDIFKATELLDISLKHGLVNIEKRTVQTDDANGFDIFVDSDIKELFVEAAGSCNSIELFADKTPLAFEHSVKVDYLFVGSVNVTSYGKYKLTLKTDNACRVKITGKSTKSFTQSVAKSAINETAPKCLEVIEQNPTRNDKTTMLVDTFGLHDDDVIKSIDFVDDKTSEVIQNFRVADGSKRHFRILLDSLQDRQVLAYVSGVDVNGFQFRRLGEHYIKFDNIKIDCSALENVLLKPSSSAQVSLVLKNAGKVAEYYTVGASDSENFILSVPQARVLVPAGGDAKVFLRLRASKNTKDGTVSKAIITAKDRNGTLVHKECQITISPKLSPEIEYFQVTSNINTRFAETTIQSKFVNDGWVSKEAVFHVAIPKDAFITKFSMTVNGETYHGQVKSLEDAKSFYEVGKREGLTLGRIASKDKSMNMFQTSVNLRGDEDVVFEIKYQQRLERIAGIYREELHLHPGHPAGRVTVEVNIDESLPIKDLRVLKFRTGQSSVPGGVTVNNAKITKTGNSAKITYSLDREQQTKLSPNGINGKFTFEYDLTPPSGKISEMVAFNKNFLHYFVPEYGTMGKRVVLLLDNSGSMYGTKMQQVKDATARILDNLKPKDSFALMMFSTKVRSWDPHPGDDTKSIMVPATSSNVAAAKKFLDSVTTNSGTDIEKGVEVALNVIEGYVEDENITPHQSTDFIFVVTDGFDVEKDGDSGAIVSSITDLNRMNFSMNIVGFGSQVKSDILSNLALKNKGKYIQIYQDTDADQQMIHFFNLLANPMLYDIQIRYPSGRIIPTTKVNFKQYQKGTELVVSGRFADNASKCVAKTNKDETFDMTFSAKTDGDDVFVEEQILPACQDETPESDELREKERKHLQLVDLIQELETEDNPEKIGELKNQITEIATENDFIVHDYTAMVVSKPNDVQEVDEIIAAELEDADRLRTETSTTPKPTTPTTTALTIAGGSVVTPAFGRLPFSTITPFTASRPRLEFFGDPHFVIDIEKQITLCFNWEGEEGQTINLLHDPVKGVTVNGKLVTSKSPDKSARSIRTYVNKIGINIEKKNISLMITAKEVILRVSNKERISLPFGKNGSKRKNGILLKVKPVTKFKSTLFIHVNSKTIFRVISRINSKNAFVKDHLDFAVLRGDGLSNSAVGVLGQFSKFKAKEKIPASIEFRSDGKTALLWYRQNPIEVSYHVLKDYNSDREVECWYMSDKKQLWENDEQVFAVRGILDPPETKSLEHR